MILDNEYILWISFLKTHKYYQNVYNSRKSYWDRKTRSQYMLDRDQIQQAYGDLDYLFNCQMERFFEKIIAHELRYLQFSVITATERPREIYEFIPQTSNRIIPTGFIYSNLVNKLREL